MFDELKREWKAYLQHISQYSKETHLKAEQIRLKAEKTDKYTSKDVEMIDAIFEDADVLDSSTQVTLAIGYFAGGGTLKFIGAKQAGKLPDYFVGMVPPPGYKGEKIIDAYEILTNHDHSWYVPEKTGIHAEVMIIRSWLLEMEAVNETGLKQLKGNSVIVASQPACWCCATLMTKYGIDYPADAGSKPRTAWRHPLGTRSVPNSELPKSQANVDTTWLETARLYKGLM